MQEALYDPREAAGLAVLEQCAVHEAQLFAERAEQLHASLVLSERLHGVDGVDRFLVLDVAGTLGIGQLSASALLTQAERLVTMQPELLALLRAGQALLPQARVVLEATRHTSPAVTGEVDRRLVPVLAGDDSRGWAAARLRRHVEALVLEVEAAMEPRATADRQQDARASRRVSVRPEPDGMGSLWALLPAEALRAFAQGLDELARRQAVLDRAAGVERTADQRRADLLASLPAVALHAADGTAPLVDATGRCSHPTVVLDVQVPVATLLGLADAPGHLTGYGPLPADHVRSLLPGAHLRRVVVDATTGEVLHCDSRLVAPARSPGRPAGPGVGHAARQADDDLPAAGATSTGPTASTGSTAAGTTAGGPTAGDLDRLQRLLADETVLLGDPPESGYVPSRPLARLVRARDPLCTGPGCATSSRSCDLDHAVPWPLGPTSAANLRPHSRRCHRAKTLSWRTSREPDGTVVWTSPTSRSYRVPALWQSPPAARPRPVPPRPRPAEQPACEERDEPLLSSLSPRPVPPPRPAPVADRWGDLGPPAPF